LKARTCLVGMNRVLKTMGGEAVPIHPSNSKLVELAAAKWPHQQCEPNFIFLNLIIKTWI
jgi:hypothetical protein